MWHKELANEMRPNEQIQAVIGLGLCCCTAHERQLLQAYQFTLEGIIRLPPFQELSGSPSATASAPSATAGLDLDAVSVLTLYSKVYCAVLDRAGRRLLLHRFYK